MIQRLERLAAATVFGVRFRDAVTGVQVRDGLEVSAWPSSGGRRTRAFRTASDLYALQGLQGLEDLESGRRPLDFQGSPGIAPLPYVVQVADRLERFLDTAFEVSLPLPYPGPYLEGAPGSPALDGFPLFRAPGARAEPWMGEVRGELRDRDGDAGAAHARVRVFVADNPPATGFADASGRFLVVVPLPSLRPFPGGSPGVGPSPDPGLRSLAAGAWPVALEVLWEPGVQRRLRGTASPDLDSLFAQGPAEVWSEAAASPASTWGGELRYGVPLVARSPGASELLVRAAVTSP